MIRHILIAATYSPAVCLAGGYASGCTAQRIDAIAQFFGWRF
jgi:hypothetical protein